MIARASIETVDTLMQKTIGELRYRALMSAAFGVLSIILAAVGLYGLLSRRVAEQRREFGIRLAIGAHPWQIVRLVTSNASRLLTIGILTGLPAAWGAGLLLRTQLFSVQPWAPHVFAIDSLVLVVTALFASAVPAVVASRFDSMIAMRTDV